MTLALTYDAPKRRTVIASKARAAQIIERVAEKHRIEVSTMLCARWDRFVAIARAEAAAGLRDDLGWSLRMIGEYLGCSHESVRQLFTLQQKYARRASLIHPVPDVDGRIRELEAEVARLSGTYLCERLAVKFGLQMRCAILLAILAEAYPRYVRGPAILQLYDEACETIGYGHQSGATYNLIAKNASHLNTRMRELGAGADVASVIKELPGARRMDDAAAAWLSDQCGAPKRSQIERLREAGVLGAGV